MNAQITNGRKISMTTEELRALIRDMSLQEKIAQVSQIGMESFLPIPLSLRGRCESFI